MATTVQQRQRSTSTLNWLLSWRFLEDALPPDRAFLVGYIATGAGIALASVAIGIIFSLIHVANLSVLYLVVVLASAVRFGQGPAIAASVAAFLAYDWLFVQPLHTFTIADPEEWIALLIFLMVAVVASQLAAAQRRRADEAQRREHEARLLYAIGRILNAQDDLDTSLQQVVERLRDQLALAGAAVTLPNRPLVEVGAGAAPNQRGALAVQVLPLTAGERTLGTLRLAMARDRAPWTREETRLLSAATDQIAQAIERARLRQAATEAEVLRKTDEVRQAVLAAVSHDLRTPLASIQGSAESLLQPEIAWSDEERHAFLTAIRQEAAHLHRLVENLLDLSRIEAGRLQPDRDWFPLDTLVDDVLARLEPITAEHPVTVDVPEDLPPVPLDYVQIGEVVANLVENATRYTPPGTPITISARQEGAAVRVAVADEGSGIPRDALPYVFEKFYRVAGGDRALTKGTGLGLAVARGFVEAHGGAIEVHSPAPGKTRGTVFTFTLPLTIPGREAPVALEEVERR